MKLHIRRFQRTDLDSLHELLSDEEVMRYIELPFTMEQTRAFLEEAGLPDSPLIYAVADESGAFIGYVIYHDYEKDSKEIGWILKRAAWRNGYAETLTKMLMDWARLENKAVVIECAPEQGISKHIAEKFGFSYIGQRDGCDVYKLENL